MSDARRYLLDTNVLSETRVSRPNPRVLAFFQRADKDAFFLSEFSIGELRKGIALRRKTDSTVAKRLADWVDGLEQAYADRILGIDRATVTLWGELAAQRTRPVIDTLLAATAITHNLTLVTRNIKDVQDTGVKLINPWL